MVWKEMLFEVFQVGHHGGHLRYGNRRILAILSLYNSPKPPIKFQLNLTYCLGLDVIWRISRWPPWWPSWISEQNDFSNSESLCHCDASHEVLAQSNFRFGRRCHLRITRWPPWQPSWISERTILAILNLYVAPMPPIKFRLNLTYGFGGDIVWRISRWPPWWPSWISTRNNFTNSESLCHCDVWEEMSLMATAAAILDSGMEQF